MQKFKKYLSNGGKMFSIIKFEMIDEDSIEKVLISKMGFAGIKIKNILDNYFLITLRSTPKYT